MSYQKPRANTVSTTRRKTLCRVRSDIKELLFIKLTYFVFVPLLLKQILTKQKKASTKNSQEFLPSQVPVLKRNKATNSNTSDHPFFSCNEKPFIWLFIHDKLFRLAITFAREVCHLWIKMKTNMTIVLFFSSNPQQQTARMASLKSLNKLPNTQESSLQLKNGWLKVLELVALFAAVKVKFDQHFVQRILRSRLTSNIRYRYKTIESSEAYLLKLGKNLSWDFEVIYIVCKMKF